LFACEDAHSAHLGGAGNVIRCQLSVVSVQEGSDPARITLNRRFKIGGTE